MLLTCTLLALYFTVRDLSYHHFLMAREQSLPGFLKPNLLSWYAWGLLFFPLRAACRFLLGYFSRLPRFIFWHLLLFVAAIFCHSGLTLLEAGVIHGFSSASFTTHTLTFPGFIFQFMGEYDFLVYFVVIGSVNYHHYLKRSIDPKIAIMQGQLVDAQIQNLRNQMHPHFLFNALNTVTAFIPGDGAKAIRMLKLLSGLFRDSLRATSVPELPLADELRFVDNYLQIERLRFGERLQVVHMVEEQARAALFPAMMLQTLVENAVRHGRPVPACQLSIRKDERFALYTSGNRVPGSEQVPLLIIRLRVLFRPASLCTSRLKYLCVAHSNRAVAHPAKMPQVGRSKRKLTSGAKRRFWVARREGPYMADARH